MEPVYFLPLIAALIGWLTNHLAVKMLFHPRRRISFGIFSIQGVFPKRQKALAQKLGEVVATQLISPEDIRKILKENAHSPALEGIIEAYIEQAISEKLPEVIPMLSAFMNPVLVETVKQVFSSHLGDLVEKVVDELGDNLDEVLDIHKMVEDKVAAFSSDRLEEILLSIMRKEFRFIEIIGAVLGLLIGILQLAMVKYSILLELVSSVI